MPIITYYPTVFTGIGPASTAGSIASEMVSLGADIEFVTPWSTGAWPKGVSGRSAGRLRLPYRLIANSPLLRLARNRIESAMLAKISRSTSPVVLHLWPGASAAFLTKAKACGATIIREMINTHEGYAKRILDAESQRIGLSPQHSITLASVEAEQACLELCDFIFSPSAIVDTSLEEFGFSGDGIGQVSFGWEPAKFARVVQPNRKVSPAEGLTALFVGSIGVRKGAHLALEAWVKSGVVGKLVFLGRVEPDFRPILDSYLGNCGIEHHDFVPDPQSYFASADFFLFPTLEEGAPLVCYEAAGCGLPIVTTRAGTARMVENGVNGRVIDAHVQDELVAAIQQMAQLECRTKMGENARERAADFTWRAAARLRLEVLGERVAA